MVDISSDLLEMSRRAVCVVCAGPKAILDVPATAEALETLGIPVIGYRTFELPAFYTGESGIALEHRVEDAAQMAMLLRAHWEASRWGRGTETPMFEFHVTLKEIPPEVLREARAEAKAMA